MQKINVKIKKLRENAHIPAYQTPGAAACDLVSCEEITIPARGRAKVPTGIAIECEGAAILLLARSGLAANHGIALANGVGLVDPDYRGEIMVAMINNSDENYAIHPGDRVAQMMFVPYATAEFTETDDLDETERGSGGFGSSGRRE